MGEWADKLIEAREAGYEGDNPIGDYEDDLVFKDGFAKAEGYKKFEE